MQLTENSFAAKLLYAAILMPAIGLIAWLLIGIYKPRTISFNYSTEVAVPVGKMSIVGQFTLKDQNQTQLSTTGNSNFEQLSLNLKALPGIQIVENQEQVVSNATGAQYTKSFRIDITEITQLDSVMALLNIPSVAVIQTIYIPKDKKSADEASYKQLLAESKQRARSIAKAGGSQLGMLLSVTDSPSQVREDGSLVAIRGANNELLMPYSKTSTITYAIW